MKNDLINREEATIPLKRVILYGAKDKDGAHPISAELVFSHLISLPSVDRVQGKWIHNPNGIDRDFIWWKCSECGHVIYSESEHDREEFHAFCGRCGARMKGTINGEDIQSTNE